MINKEYLKFDVLTKPEKDLFKKVQSNAKFKSLSDVIRTKVGINNFYNFSITIQSSIVLRDIILNSQFVSGWARSSQVLNKSDSKFACYRFLTHTKKQTEKWISTMEMLQSKKHSQDNMRALIWLDSINDYAISIDILHLIYLALVLDSMYKEVHDKDLQDEIGWFLHSISELLFHEYDINYNDFDNMLADAMKDFPVINAELYVNPNDITGEFVYDVNATYSVIGQIWRHRTLVKQYGMPTYDSLLQRAKEETAKYDYSKIGMHTAIENKIKHFTDDAKSIYDICQGSIVPFKFSGTIGAVHKALSQRTCFINDSPQFKDTFDAFSKNHPALKLLPPCRLNATSSNSCYVGYVNESRMRGEELTQVCCPIYAKAKGYEDVYKDSLSSSKTKWYIDNFKMWKNVCK